MLEALQLALTILGVALVLVIVPVGCILIATFRLLDFCDIDIITLEKTDNDMVFPLITERFVQKIHSAAWRGLRLIAKTEMSEVEREQLRKVFFRWRESAVIRESGKITTKLFFNPMTLSRAQSGYIGEEMVAEWQSFAEENGKLYAMLRLYRFVKPVLHLRT